MVYNFLRFPGGKAKAVTFSYDDGSEPDIRLLEHLNRYNLKCTFNLVGSKVEKERGLTQEFILKNILGKGHEVANHGYIHRALDTVRPIEGIQEILMSRMALEKTFGTIIRGLAYADRNLDRFKKPLIYEKIKQYLKELDIAYARAAAGDNDQFLLPEDWYCWMPSAHHKNPRLMEYIDKFLTLDTENVYRASREARLFYIWGHSSEFEKDNNWELLDEICRKLSGKEEIWYATNMEIYQYVTAYHALCYSADSTVIYNPTLIDVWLDIDGEVHMIKSGETYRL